MQFWADRSIGLVFILDAALDATLDLATRCAAAGKHILLEKPIRSYAGTVGTPRRDLRHRRGQAGHRVPEPVSHPASAALPRCCRRASWASWFPFHSAVRMVAPFGQLFCRARSWHACPRWRRRAAHPGDPRDGPACGAGRPGRRGLWLCHNQFAAPDRHRGRGSLAALRFPSGAIGVLDATTTSFPGSPRTD